MITIIITALLSWAGAYLLGWWMVAVVPFAVAIITQQKALPAFISGFLSIGVLWLYLILKLDLYNEHILSTRMANLLGMAHALFIVVNVLLGAIVGGLGAWAGACLRKLFPHK